MREPLLLSHRTDSELFLVLSCRNGQPFISCRNNAAPTVLGAPLDHMGAYMRKSYDWSADVKKLTMPVMLIYGDSDMIRPEHIVKFYQLLGGGLKDAGWQREHMSQNRLAILPNLTHYEMGLAPQLVDTALPFLNSAARAKSGDEQVSGK